MTSKQIRKFIAGHYKQFTNTQLAEKLGIPIQSIRQHAYALGLKRMELEFFSREQIRYLKSHFRKIGDLELAQIFQQKWPKKKGWTKKHIEKKRNYLHLKRTIAELGAIHQRNKRRGSYKAGLVKTWNTRGRFPEETIRYWKNPGSQTIYPVIKINGRFVKWARWMWEKHNGAIPNGKNVVFLDRDPFNLTLENLVLLNNAELCAFNNQISNQGLSDNYIAGLLSFRQKELRAALKQNKPLLELKRFQITLNRKIYETEHTQKRSGKHD